jgi:hypothetical protein
VFAIGAPSDVREEFAGDEFCAGCINFYVCNGSVIAPEFGDRRTDEAARRTLADVFPGRVIEQLNIDGIAGAEAASTVRLSRSPRSQICVAPCSAMGGSDKPCGAVARHLERRPSPATMVERWTDSSQSSPDGTQY